MRVSRFGASGGEKYSAEGGCPPLDRAVNSALLRFYRRSTSNLEGCRLGGLESSKTSRSSTRSPTRFGQERERFSLPGFRSFLTLLAAIHPSVRSCGSSVVDIAGQSIGGADRRVCRHLGKLNWVLPRLTSRSSTRSRVETDSETQANSDGGDPGERPPVGLRSSRAGGCGGESRTGGCGLRAMRRCAGRRKRQVRDLKAEL